MAHKTLSNPDDGVSALQRQMNNISKDFTIPSLGSMQAHHYQTAEPSRMVRRSSWGHLSFAEPESRSLHSASDVLRPASAYARSSNLARPLSGIREASESSLAERALSKGRPSGNDASVDDASWQLNPNMAKVSSTISLPPSSLPERKSSQGLLQRRNSRTSRMARNSMDVPSLIVPPPLGSGLTIRSRGHSTSPVRAAAARLDPISPNMRKTPSRTFVRSVRPTDILEFPRIRHQRIALDMRVSTPIFMGGGTVEGQLRIMVDGGAGHGRRKAKPLLSLGRISVDILGVEELSNGKKRWIFRSLANELIDQSHPPPSTMASSSVALADAFWELVPSAATLPFRLNLPVNMGPPPYHSKCARIRYILCTSVLVKVAGEPCQIRESQDIAILSVHDRTYMEGQLSHVQVLTY